MVEVKIGKFIFAPPLAPLGGMGGQISKIHPDSQSILLETPHCGKGQNRSVQFCPTPSRICGEGGRGRILKTDLDSESTLLKTLHLILHSMVEVEIEKFIFALSLCPAPSPPKGHGPDLEN